MLAQSIALSPCQPQKKAPIKPPVYRVVRKLLNTMQTNNVLLKRLLEATDRANALAAEQLKALKEQNDIHRILVQQQQRDHAHEPFSPSSCANQRPPSSVNTPMSAHARHHLADGAFLAGRLAMLLSARSPRPLASASSPNLQSLHTSADAAQEVPSMPLSPIFSPANTELAATAQPGSTATAASGTQPPPPTLKVKIDGMDNKS